MAGTMKSYIVMAALALGQFGGSAQAQTPPDKSARYSCYVFRDMNRNGIFDMGDKPYSLLRLEVTRPDGSKTWVRSNIDGFANLEASLGDKDAVIYETGEYQIRAVFPKGWQTKSASQRQSLVMREQSNARSGLVPEATCRPIGAMPVLEIRGIVRAQDGSSLNNLSVVATHRDEGTRLDLTIGDTGEFRGIGTQGPWRLEVRDSAGQVVHARDFRLEHAAVHFSDIIVGQTRAPELDTSYEELDFDGFVVGQSLFELPSGYGGLNWLNLISVHNRFYRGGGYVNGTISSEFVAYNSSGAQALVWVDDATFDFKGAYVAVAWPRGNEDKVRFRAWRGETLAYEDHVFVSNRGPVFFDASYEDITRLEVVHGNYERVVLDNFQFKK